MPSPATYRDDCSYCVWARHGLPGGWLYQDEYWCIGSYGHQIMPGFVVQLKRHVEEVGELTPAEWVALGPNIGAVSRAMESEPDIERVYVVSFCELHRHRHFLVTPLAPDVPSEYRMWRLFEYVTVGRKKYDPLGLPGVRDRVQEAILQELGAVQR